MKLLNNGPITNSSLEEEEKEEESTESEESTTSGGGGIIDTIKVSQFTRFSVQMVCLTLSFTHKDIFS